MTRRGERGRIDPSLSALSRLSTYHACVDTRVIACAFRFVGLLLVTKLLPQGGDAAVMQVLDALGPTFIDRLLLPLTRQRQVSWRADAIAAWVISSCWHADSCWPKCLCMRIAPHQDTCARACPLLMCC